MRVPMMGEAARAAACTMNLRRVSIAVSLAFGAECVAACHKDQAARRLWLARMNWTIAAAVHQQKVVKAGNPYRMVAQPFVAHNHAAYLPSKKHRRFRPIGIDAVRRAAALRHESGACRGPQS